METNGCYLRRHHPIWYHISVSKRIQAYPSVYPSVYIQAYIQAYPSVALYYALYTTMYYRLRQTLTIATVTSGDYVRPSKMVVASSTCSVRWSMV
jgi:hypothetical protein